jgi:hypothetical protein
MRSVRQSVCDSRHLPGIRRWVAFIRRGVHTPGNGGEAKCSPTTEEDLQPNIDGLSRDEVLLIGLVPVAVAVVVTRWMARRHARQAADEHEESSASNRGHLTPHES